MATALWVRPNRAVLRRDSASSKYSRRPARRPVTTHIGKVLKNDSCRALVFNSSRRMLLGVLLAGSRADDSAPFEMSVENALKLLGVSEGASFDDILRAKNSIIAGCKDDQDTIAQVLIYFLYPLFSINGCPCNFKKLV